MPIDEAIVDGDTGFIGVNSRLDPSQLPEGYVANAVNKRFVNGVAETRAGIKKMPWSNKAASTYDDTVSYSSGDYVLYSGRKVDTSGDTPSFSNVDVGDPNTTTTDGSTPLAATAGPASNSLGPFFKATGTTDAGDNPLDVENALQDNWSDAGHKIFGYGNEVYGAGVFRDPSGREHLIVASSSGTYATRDGAHSEKLICPDISADVSFVQCFNVVVMMRGASLPPLVMKSIKTGFVSITQEDTDTTLDENDEGDGTEPIPASDSALYFANRLLVPFDKDMVAVSDYLSYTRYAPIMSSFRIQQGSEDDLVAIQKLNNTTLAAFKSNSIYMVSNIYGNLSDAVLDEVTRDFGAVSFKSTIQVGSDIWFLSSKKGVCSLSVAANGKITAVQQPVSEAIQPLIERINWNHAGKAVAATYNNRYYLATCIDGATSNNAVLVYDLLQQAWSGYDTGSAVKVKEFVEMEFQGKRRLFFLSTDGYINLYDDDLGVCGFVDEVGASDGGLSVEQISDEVTTRGYTAKSIAQKKWRGAELHLSTNDPKFTVTTIYDGPEEDGVTLASSKEFSRTKYDKPFDKPAFIRSNTNNDFLTRYREDYSVKLSDLIVDGVNKTNETGGADITLPTGSCSAGGHSDLTTCEANSETWTYSEDPIDKGFDPDLHQSSANKYKFRGTGRYVQLKVANTQGRLKLNTVKVGALAGENLIRKEL